MEDKVRHIIWHSCEDELPKESGNYLVSRYGYMYDEDIREFRICKNIGLRYIDIGFFLVDFQMWDNDKRKNIYAWAEMPEPM